MANVNLTADSVVIPPALKPMLHELRPGWIYHTPLTCYSPFFNVANADDSELAVFAANYLFNNYGGGRLTWGPFNYTAQTTLQLPANNMIYEGHGNSTLWSFFGSAAGLSSHDNFAQHQVIQGNAAKFRDFTLDGSNQTPTAMVTGMSVGDAAGISIDGVTINNFTASGQSGSGQSNPIGAVGLALDNQVVQTEKFSCRNVVINNCGTPNFTGSPTNGGGAGLLIVSSTGTTTSFMYSHDIEVQMNQQPGQNGLVIGEGGNLTNGRFKMYGNFNCPQTGVNQCAGIVIGVRSQPGHISNMNMDVYCEMDQNLTAAQAPFTIYGGNNVDNTMNRCFGRLQFLGTGVSGWQNSNLPTGTNGTFEWSGPLIGGDNVLNTPPGLGTIVSGNQVTYNGPDAMMFFSVSGGTMSSIIYNGTTVFTAGLAGPFIVCAGTKMTFTFTGAMSYEFIRFGQGNVT